MATQEGLTHRAAAMRDDGAAGGASRDTSGRKLQGRAKRGARSLAAAVSVSAALTFASFYGASGKAGSSSSTTVAIARAGSVAAEAVMALAAWMVWAEGGLHRRPATTLAPFAAQLLACAAWAPLALGLGMPGAGVAACVAMAAGAVGCARGFGNVNPVAGDLAKPCVAWAVLLAVMSYKMMKY